MSAVGKAVGDGIAAGALHALRISLLVLAFLVGIAVALLSVWLAGTLSRRRPAAK